MVSGRRAAGKGTRNRRLVRRPRLCNSGAMNSLKTVLVFMMTGALLGVVIASLIVPPILSWYNEPGAIAPGRIETLCNLPELIRYTSTRLIRGQIIGAAVGALLFMVPGVMTVRRRSARVEAPATV
jgi:hypothetical protein